MWIANSWKWYHYKISLKTTQSPLLGAYHSATTTQLELPGRPTLGGWLARDWQNHSLWLGIPLRASRQGFFSLGARISSSYRHQTTQESKIQQFMECIDTHQKLQFWDAAYIQGSIFKYKLCSYCNIKDKNKDKKILYKRFLGVGCTPFTSVRNIALEVSFRWLMAAIIVLLMTVDMKESIRSKCSLVDWKETPQIQNGFILKDGGRSSKKVKDYLALSVMKDERRTLGGYLLVCRQRTIKRVKVSSLRFINLSFAPFQCL